MILTIERLKQFVSTTTTDLVLEAKLQALEMLIRKYTNNNFQSPMVRMRCGSIGTDLQFVNPYIKVDDTIQISQSGVNDGLYHVVAVTESVTTLDREMFNVETQLITKIVYPLDVQMGVINLMKWEETNRDKTGIQSETISRHSVTYFNVNEGNSVAGYPTSLLSFLEPYRKARF